MPLNRVKARSVVVCVVVLLLVAILFVCLTARSQSPKQVRMEVIIVGSLEDAERIEEQLKSGADFALLASKNSIDSTASNGGYLGMTDPAALRSELRDAVRDLQPGQFSPVVKTPFGYTIVKLLRGEGNAAVPRQIDSGQTGMLAAAGGVGSVRATQDTSGYSSFLMAEIRTIQNLPGFGLDLQQACSVRRQAPQEAITKFQRLFAKDSTVSDQDELSFARYTLASLYASQGNIDEAITRWENIYKLSSDATNDVKEGLEETLGDAYLHRAQKGDHAALDAIDESWLVPTRPGAPQALQGDAEKAISYFTAAVRRDPANYELRWLLNLAYMTAGTWPASVPAQYLIPPSVFASKEDLGKFPDVAPSAGVAVLGEAGGVIIDDFDNDGLLDIVESQIDDCEPLRFFHNNGDGTFTDRSAQAGLLDQTGGLNIIQADYNNDGCVDILVLRGGWEFPRRRSLLRNNCDGTFTDVTAESGLLDPTISSQSAVWTDIDNDGNLDLFIANENAPAQLFLNKGDGTFIDIAKEAGVDRVGFSKSVVAADYDNDGYPDLYVTNQNGQGFLYHNNGDRSFTEVAATAGVRSPRYSFASMFFDYDNDGWPDLFITSYFGSVEESVRSYLGLPLKGETLKLYKNMGDGTFRDVTAEVGLNRIFMPMGANFGDVDNDGFLDIYLGMGNPSFSALLPNVLLHNKDGKRFIDISASSRTGALAKGHGVAFADLGNNGDEDILVNMGGAEPGDQFTTRLFRNPGGHGNDWISLRLVGVKTNRSAIGARITVTVTNPDRGRRKIVRTVGSGGSFGASPLQQHIGLGRSAHIEKIEVWWPTSKTRQNFSGVSPNQFLEIKEFDAQPTKLLRRSFELGGTSRAGVPPLPSIKK